MQNRQGFSGFALKMIAVVSMVIDHSAATILRRLLVTARPEFYSVIYENWEYWNDIYRVLRGIGRLAFPIYCYLLVEGFVHTKSVRRYANRLLLFAFLSEIPFDIALRQSLWDIKHNNVFFTLFIGLLTLCAMDAVIKYFRNWTKESEKRSMNTILCILLCGLIVAAGFALAEYVLFTDYGGAGVLAIVLMYVLRLVPEIAMASSVAILGWLCGELEFVAFADVLLLHFYNGKRGRQMKMFFYAIYPIHLLILSGICFFIGI